MCYFIVCPSRFVWCWQEYHRTDVISLSVNNTMGCLFIPLVVLLIIITIIKWYLSSLKVKLLSRVRLFATPRTVAYQAPQSMELSRQEYWSRLPSPSPGDLPNPAIEPRSPALQADALPPEPPEKPLAEIVTLWASNSTKCRVFRELKTYHIKSCTQKFIAALLTTGRKGREVIQMSTNSYWVK